MWIGSGPAFLPQPGMFGPWYTPQLLRKPYQAAKPVTALLSPAHATPHNSTLSV
jgi:hypothetical protein